MTSPASHDAAWLEIAEFPLSTEAWWITDHSEAFDSPPVRGGNELMPGARGRRAFPLVADQLRVTYPLVILGDVDEDGVPLPDHIDGVAAHLAAIKNGLGISLGATGAVETAVFHLPGSDLTTGMQVIGLYGSRDITRGIRTTLDVVIPSGLWEEVVAS